MQRIRTAAVAGCVEAALAADADAEEAGSLLAVELQPGDELPPTGMFGPAVFPGVTVGIAERPVRGGRLAELDLLLTAAGNPPSPWVGVGDLEAAVAELGAAVDRAPLASAVLVDLLRHGASRSVEAGLIAESASYSMLLAGREFQSWLDRRERPRPGRVDGDERTLLTRRRGGVLHLTLDRPGVRNAIDARLRERLVDALTAAVHDHGLDRIELDGRGPAFCAGGDLREFGTFADPVGAHLLRTRRCVPRLLHALAPRTRVSLHGAAIGAGIELGAFAERVSARADTLIALPEVSMGLIPGAGGTVSIPARVGRHRAAWLALSGASLDAHTAVAWGLVDTIH